MPDDPTTGATPGGGATPPAAGQGQPAGGATPPATEPTTQPPATGDEGLGEAGKAALRREREAAAAEKKRADAAEEELRKLREATQSDQDKALADARKEGERTATERWQGAVRSANVMSALRSAGVANEKLVATLAKADAFSKLEARDDGTVAGLDEALAAAKSDFPEAFKSVGEPTRGVAGDTPGDEPKTLRDAIAAEIKKT